MQLGACYAGVAIEKSMLGATHACANPLTARYGINHGTAISALLPHVVKWNASTVSSDYLEMLAIVGEATKVGTPGSLLAALLERLARTAKLPTSLKELGVPQGELGGLAEEAATQWTGKFNPRSFNKDGAMEIYKCAF